MSGDIPYDARLPDRARTVMNLASQRLIDPKIFNDKTVYPDDDTLKRLFVITARDPATQRIINRLWIRVKTGR